MNSKIYINGELLGACENPVEFTQEMREKRRNGKISHEMNITYYEDTNDIYIFTDPGRARRPLIIVKEGISLLREEHLNRVANGKLKWDDLIDNGLIEYLDAEEEENSYIAMSLAELNEEHTHLEIDPSTILGICAGIIPFSDHNSSPRNTMGAGIAKQALGLYISNYALRMDTRAHLLHHPQTPIVKTRIIDSANYDLRPSGQNFVIALMSYEGYNMEDSMVINKASLERGLARSSFFRAYDTSEKRYFGGQVDKFEVPSRNIKGYRSEYSYRNLDEDGFVNPESEVKSGDVLIGKTSPPRFLEEDFDILGDRRRETSVTVRQGEKGIVDAVLLSETVEGSRLAKIRVRDSRQPELGDKFSSRHGQKGVIGLILSPEDVPFTEFGVVPDLIINPHAIPSRMTVGLVLEMVAGKAGCLEGERVDATPFNQDLETEIKQQLLNNGFESAGCESLYSGVTGERFDAEIFVGVAYYQKLHHMTTDKIYARARGPVQVLTRQPTEGRAHEGGLRFGEMERDCLIAHGAAMTLKERLLDESDKYVAHVCENCGMLAVYDKNRNKIYCPVCGDLRTYPVEISYAFKLLLDELKGLCIFPKLVLGDKTAPKKTFKKKSKERYKPPKRKNVIEGPRLVEDEPSKIEPEVQVDEKLENCIVCGKKLNKNQKNICKSCARKQYASRIIKKLVTVVKPEIPFKKEDLKSLELADLQIKDYIWTLQEFNLVDVENNKYKLKDENTLNEFRIKSKMDPIDFDSILSEDKLNKICKTCGKTLPISDFYKTSDGYEDNCKNCKRLIGAANNLNLVIKNIGFNNEFRSNDLKEYIPNQNQLMGVIWSLQDNDLLIETSPDFYILADKSKCLEFLDKYCSESKSVVDDVDEVSVGEESRPFVDDVDEVSVGEESRPFVDDVKKAKPKNKKEQMKIVLKARKTGKTREEAAQLADIPLYKINHWYKEGRQGFGKDNVKFYKQLKRIEDKLLNSTNSNERKQMEFVLKLLRQGKSKAEVAKLTEINVSTITSWFNQGKEKTNENTIYFYNEVNKIRQNESKQDESIPESEVHKSGREKSDNSESTKSADDERVKMDIVLNALRKGKSRHDAAKEAGILITQISNWDMNGRFEYSKNTTYFRNEIKKIEMDILNKEKSIPKSDDVHKPQQNVSDNSKSVDDERVKMDIVLNALRKGKSRHDAAKEAKIHITKISGWEMNGILEYSENTIYFNKELKNIESDESTIKSDEKNDNFNVSKTIEDTNDSNFFNVNHAASGNPNKSAKSENINKNNSNNKINTGASKEKSTNEYKIDLNDEKQVMDAVLSLLRKGYSRVKAAQEVGIKVGQIVIWQTQGRNNHSENTVYFYNQLNLIEKK